MSTGTAVTSLDEYRARRNAPDRLFTYQELSVRLGRSVRQLQRDRRRGMPVAYEFGRLLFDPAEVERWRLESAS